MDHPVHTENLYLMSEAQLRLFFWLTVLRVSTAAISLLQGRSSPLSKWNLVDQLVKGDFVFSLNKTSYLFCVPAVSRRSNWSYMNSSYCFTDSRKWKLLKQSWCCHGSGGTLLPHVRPPAAWATVWTGLSTCVCDWCVFSHFFTIRLNAAELGSRKEVCRIQGSGRKAVGRGNKCMNLKNESFVI